MLAMAADSKRLRVFKQLQKLSEVSINLLYNFGKDGCMHGHGYAGDPQAAAGVATAGLAAPSAPVRCRQKPQYTVL